MPNAPNNPYMKWTGKGCGWSTVTKQTSDCIMRTSHILPELP